MARGTTADVEVRIFGNIHDFSQKMNQAKLDAMGFQQKMLAMSGVMKSWGRNMTMGITVPVVAGLALATKAAMDDAKSQEVLRKQIANVTDATDAEVASLEDFINAQSRATGVMDDLLRPAISRLIAATGDLGLSQKLLGVSQDVAAGTGKNLDSVITAMIKGANGTTSGFQRMGIATKDASGKALTFEQIVASLEKKFKGMAEAKASPFAKLQVALAEMGESIGAVLLPAVTKMATAIGWLAAKTEKMPGWLRTAAVAVALFAAAIGPVLWGLGAMAQGIRAIKEAWDVAKRVFRIGTWGTETAAITANTAALSANNVARGIGAAIPGPMGAGLRGAGGAGAVAPGLIGTGTGGLGAGGAAAGVGLGTVLAGATAALAAGIIAAELVGHPKATEQRQRITDSGVTYGGRMTGSVADAVKVNQAIGKSYDAGSAALGKIAEQIKGLEPTPENAAALDAYQQQIKAIGTQYPEVKDRAEAMTKALEEQKPAWREAVAAAEAAMEELKKGILDSATSVFEALSKATAAGLRLTATELAAVAAANPFKGTPGWTPEANADNAPLKQHGVKYHKFARGGSGITTAPMLALIGESGPESYDIKPVGSKGGRGGRAIFTNCTFSAHSPRELMDMIGREVAVSMGGAG